jgi:predicted nucleic acid-binding protein
MGTKLFLDTNILVDFLDKARISHLDAVAIFSNSIVGNTQLYCSESVITTVDYLLHKILTPQLLHKVMVELVAVVIILPCTNEIVETALKNNSGDLEDAILYQIALEGKMDYFVTNDKKALKMLKKGSLEVLSSKGMIMKIKNYS